MKFNYNRFTKPLSDPEERRGPGRRCDLVLCAGTTSFFSEEILALDFWRFAAAILFINGKERTFLRRGKISVAMWLQLTSHEVVEHVNGWIFKLNRMARFGFRIIVIAIFSLTQVISMSLIAQSTEEQMRLSDAPAEVEKESILLDRTYQETLESWDHVDSVNQWIGRYFGYDMSRAIKLGEGSGQRGTTKILTPEEFYQNPQGVCLDLSRFAVETLRKISRDYEANYLMIEFEPLEIKGVTLRKHWIAVYMDDGLYCFAADSKYPGRTYEGYSDVASFIKEYELLRGRKIVSYKVVPSYEKKKKSTQKKSR